MRGQRIQFAGVSGRPKRQGVVQGLVAESNMGLCALEVIGVSSVLPRISELGTLRKVMSFW